MQANKITKSDSNNISDVMSPPKKSPPELVNTPPKTTPTSPSTSTTAATTTTALASTASKETVTSDKFLAHFLPSDLASKTQMVASLYHSGTPAVSKITTTAKSTSPSPSPASSRQKKVEVPVTPMLSHDEDTAPTAAENTEKKETMDIENATSKKIDEVIVKMEEASPCTSTPTPSTLSSTIDNVEAIVSTTEKPVPTDTITTTTGPSTAMIVEVPVNAPFQVGDCCQALLANQWEDATITDITLSGNWYILDIDDADLLLDLPYPLIVSSNDVREISHKTDWKVGDICKGFNERENKWEDGVIFRVEDGTYWMTFTESCEIAKLSAPQLRLGGSGQKKKDLYLSSHNQQRSSYVTTFSRVQDNNYNNSAITATSSTKSNSATSFIATPQQPSSSLSAAFFHNNRANPQTAPNNNNNSIGSNSNFVARPHAATRPVSNPRPKLANPIVTPKSPPTSSATPSLFPSAASTSSSPSPAISPLASKIRNIRIDDAQPFIPSNHR